MIALASSLRRAEWGVPVLSIMLAVVILRAAPDNPLPLALAAATTAGLVIWIVWQDLSTFTISDAALAAIAVVALALRWSTDLSDGEAPQHALVTIGIDVVLCAGTLLVFREAYYRFKGIDGLGLGDVKLAAAGALLVGGIGFSWALFAASLAGLAAVATSRLVHPGHARVDRLAFGAILAPALWGVWVIEQVFPRLLGS